MAKSWKAKSPARAPRASEEDDDDRKAIALSLTAILLLAIAAPAAMALTRDEYKAKVEPICKKNSEANDKILKTVRKEVKEDKLKTAGAKFIKASNALNTTYNELKAVEQPAEDAAKLTKVARLRQDRGRPVQERRHRAQGRQQVEGAEVRQQTDAERE